MDLPVNEDWYCEVCELSLNGRTPYESHLTGKHHKKRVRRLMRELEDGESAVEMMRRRLGRTVTANPSVAPWVAPFNCALGTAIEVLKGYGYKLDNKNMTKIVWPRSEEDSLEILYTESHSVHQERKVLAKFSTRDDWVLYPRNLKIFKPAIDLKKLNRELNQTK